MVSSRHPARHSNLGLRDSSTQHMATHGNIQYTVLYISRLYTGRFIMYSGITKIYYRKTVGHVFTKPVQTEGTNQTFTETRCLCKQKSSDRPLTAEDGVERVRASFLHSPKKSTGTVAKGLSMSKISVEGSAYAFGVNNSIKVGPLVFLL